MAINIKAYNLRNNLLLKILYVPSIAYAVNINPDFSANKYLIFYFSVFIITSFFINSFNRDKKVDFFC